MSVENRTMPGAIVVSTEPAVQCETWVRARLLEMLLSDPTLYVPDIAHELAQQMALVEAVATGCNQPLADALYASVWAVGLARQEGIRLANVFESRVRDLVDLILADTPTASTLASASTSTSASTTATAPTTAVSTQQRVSAFTSKKRTKQELLRK